MAFSREALESMKRADLQKLCKDYGVRANLKSDALIDLLLDTIKPQPPKERQTRRTSTRMSSVIVHDVEPSEESENQSEEPEPAPPPRTRKAKETQKRLGVGRPRVAGGDGPRAVTKSVSLSRSSGKRNRTSKSINPPQETIVEEVEPQDEDESPATPKARTPTPSPPQKKPAGPEDLEKRINDAMQPLLEQVQSLKTEMDKIQSLKAEIGQLKARLAELDPLQEQVTSLVAEVQGLKDASAAQDSELRQLKESLSNLTSSPPQPVDPVVEEKPELPHPGFAPSMLGKRPRDSTASTMTGLIEEHRQEDFSDAELAKRIIRPSKKRARLDQEPVATEHVDTQLQTPPQPRLHSDPPPPIVSLPPFFPIASGPSQTPDLAHQQSYGMNFAPAVPPTPGPGMFSTGNFSYPEPPPSPSPAATERHNIFKTNAPHASGFVNPAALNKATPDQVPVAANAPASPTDTMYGTEANSRFGDFGVEGSSRNNFWTGNRY